MIYGISMNRKMQIRDEFDSRRAQAMDAMQTVSGVTQNVLPILQLLRLKVSPVWEGLEF